MAILGKTVGFLVADETDTVEYEPIVLALRNEGVECVLIAPDLDSVKKLCLAGDCPIRTGVTVEDVCGLWLDGLVIPGGRGVDAFLHLDPAIDFVQALDAERKPIAVLGRGALMLVAADLVDGRHLAVTDELARDIVPMGGIVALSPSFKEGNWITANSAQQITQVAESLVCALESVPLPAQHPTPQGYATES